MAITVDTIQLKFNVKPSYEQQQIQELKADLKQAEANYEAINKEVKDNAREHSKLHGELSKVKAKRDELAKQKTLTEQQQRELAKYNLKIDELNDALTQNKEQQSQLLKTAESARQGMVELQRKMNGVTQSTLKYNMTIQQLSERERELRMLLNNVDPSTAEWEKYNRELTETKKRIAELRRQAPLFHDDLKLTEMSMKELSERQKALNDALQDCSPDDGDFKKYAEALKETTARMDELQQQATSTKTSLAKFLEGYNALTFAITNTLAIKDRIMGWVQPFTDEAMKYGDVVADVAKYTGQTVAEVDRMNDKLAKIDTRSSTERLNELAGAAGRLGMSAEEDIVGFVNAADKIDVSLGDDLGEGAIDQIGKLTMVFGDDKTKGLQGAMLATGSAVNELGAASSANTGFIVDFTNRVAGMAAKAGIAQTDIMGYASALSQAGVDGQVASGVFSQFVTKMFLDPAKFARAASLDVKTFTDLLNTDANAAIIQFIEAMQRKGGFGQLAPMLKELKMQGTQAIPVLTGLAGKLTELKEAQELANEAYEDGTSIINEFNTVNSTPAAQHEKNTKAIDTLRRKIGEELLPVINAADTATMTSMKILKEVISFGVRHAGVIATLASAVAAYTVVTKAQTVATKAAAAAQAVFNTITKMSPIGLIVAALTAAVAVWVKYRDRIENSTQAMGNFKTIAQTLVKVMTLFVRVITGAGGKLVEFYNRWWLLRKAVQVFASVFTAAITAVSEIIKMFVEQAGGLADVIEGALTLNWTKITAGYARGTTALSKMLAGQGKNIANTLKTIFSRDQIPGISAPDLSMGGIGKAVGNKQGNTQTGDDPTPPSETETDSGGSGGGGSKKDLAEKQRKQEEELSKLHWEREKTRLKEQLQNKQITEDEYHEQAVAAEILHLNQMADIRKRYGADESGQIETQNQLLDLYAREASYQREQQQKQMNEALQTAEMSYQADQIAMERDFWNGEYTTAEEYEAKKLEAEVDYQRQRIAIIKEYGGDATEAQSALDQAELKALKEQSAQKAKELEMLFKGQNADGTKAPKMSTADKLKAIEDNTEILGWQKKEEMKTQILQEESDKRQAIQQAAVDGVNNLLSSASSLFSAMQQRETAAVDAKYKKLIAAAKKQGRDTTKLEEQQEAEKAAIQKKYADRNFQIQVLQIVANTATGISKTISELGMPWAIPFVAMAAAAGAMQLASAKAAADQAAGLYGGGYSDDYVEGYTKKGDPKEQAGVIPVHRNEFVANHRAVANPQIRPVLDVIDRHQRRGDIQLLDSTRMLEEAYGRGRYRGGYTVESGKWKEERDYPAADISPSSFHLPLTSETLTLLQQIARNTGRSLTVRELRDEISHEEQMERNAQR